MHHVYKLFLRLLPEDFHRRYGVEMALDFEDGWREAAAGGWRRRVEFGVRASGDLAVSLLRERTRGAHLGVVAATVSVTTLLWGLALRPWSWPWEALPRPRQAEVVPVSEAELLGLAAAAVLPVLVVLLFGSRLVQRRAFRRHWPRGGIM
ncbi:MAG: hypothetical protein IT178_08230 [Acidobacteria bacterium]|nr:hypothetical protein [Acidobacteriota bacterium]